MTCSYAFSCTWHWQHQYPIGSLHGLCASVVIEQSNYFVFGFMTFGGREEAKGEDIRSYFTEDGN